jgi:hypothetical protein
MFPWCPPERTEEEAPLCFRYCKFLLGYCDVDDIIWYETTLAVGAFCFFVCQRLAQDQDIIDLLSVMSDMGLG